MKISSFMYVIVLQIFITPTFAVQKINDDFYIAKIPDKPLYLAMERITKKNLRLWKRYITVQNHVQIRAMATRLLGCHKCDYTCLSIGYNDCKPIIDSVSFENDETWIAYVTKAQTPQMIPKNISSYQATDVKNKTSPSFFKNLEAYVMITSSPNALITSHMGTAYAVEGLQSDSTIKDILIDLHSFAAKVMLERNPYRKYMVSLPSFAMLEIVFNALPGSVFIGTREMRKILEERKNTLLDDNFRTQFKNEIHVQFQKAIDRVINYTNFKLEEVLKETINGKKLSNKEIIEKFKYMNHDDEYMLIPTEIEGKLKIICPPSKQESILKKEEEYILYQYKNPFLFPLSDDFLGFMIKAPPMISIYSKTILESTFTIYNHQKPSQPWLTVEKGNKTYNWMFHEPFKSYSHPYMIVDLQALANCKQIETVTGIN